MIRFILRLAGMIALSIATIMAVLDLRRSIGESMMVVTPFSDSWEFAFPGASAATTGSGSWIEAMHGLAGIPGFLVFAMLATVLLTIGGRKHRPASI